MMQYPIAVYDRLLSAANLARDNHSNTGAYPRANAFFKAAYGTTRPNVKVLSLFGYSGSRGIRSNRDSVYHALEQLIKTDGQECNHPLNNFVASRLFPHVVHRIAQRSEHRLTAKVHVQSKIERKRQQQEDEEEIARTQAMSIDEFEDYISELSHVNDGRAYYLVFLYYQAHNNTNHRFDELYPKALNWRAWQIVSSMKREIFI